MHLFISSPQLLHLFPHVRVDKSFPTARRRRRIGRVHNVLRTRNFIQGVQMNVIVYAAMQHDHLPREDTKRQVLE